MSTFIDPHIFRAYDIRGKVDSQVTEEAMELIGKGFGSTLRELYDLEHPRIAVGRDARTHSARFEQALLSGLLSTGCHVLLIGETPSPVNYFAICNEHLDGGVQVTASHNPATDNGLKLQIRDAEAFCGDDLQKLRKKIVHDKFLSGAGNARRYDALTLYLKFLGGKFKESGTGLKVVIDAGNGVAGPTYAEMLRIIGAKVTELYTEPDGTFPNHIADPSKWDTLKDLSKLVRSEKAHIGVAFDGDGDRLGIVDEKGVVRTPDEVLLLLSQDHLARHPGKAIVFTVSNSSILQTEVQHLGGRPVMCKVGHSFVEHEMRKLGSLLGGEQSGHFFCFEDYFGYDDALVAALHVIKILRSSQCPLSQILSSFPKVFQAPELRPHCPDSEKHRIIDAITKHFSKKYPLNTLDGARIDFGGGAWAGIRVSNTSPCLSICMEARTKEKLREIREIVMEHLRKYPEITELPSTR